MIQFDEHMFQMGWFNHQLELVWNLAPKEFEPGTSVKIFFVESIHVSNRFNLTLPVQFEHVDLPVRWRYQHVMLPWPTLPFSSWVKTVFTKSYGQPLLGGHKLEETHKWTMMSSEFRERFKNARGTSHDVFRRHADRLQFCCPIAIHGDEGRGKLKRAVMATSVQPLVVPEKLPCRNVVYIAGWLVRMVMNLSDEQPGKTGEPFSQRFFYRKWAIRWGVV